MLASSKKWTVDRVSECAMRLWEKQAQQDLCGPCELLIQAHAYQKPEKVCLASCRRL
jgi:hypothetical protein